MRIALTWDYELFFGDRTGTVDSCMIQPTIQLLRIAKSTGARFTFFPDAGYIHQALLQGDREVDKVISQLGNWEDAGHETGLHIHPHWQDCTFHQGSWKMDVGRYKLSNFSREEARTIIENYTGTVNKLIGKKMTSFRAGGWCIQPFGHIADALFDHGIRMDSSVFPGGRNPHGRYGYDFTQVPDKDHWRFSIDECREDKEGNFTELPIASMEYTPLFYWKLFGWGRLRPSQHKPIGNGLPVSGGGSKKDMLTKRTLQCVSADGYFVTRLAAAVKQAERRGWNHMVVIGHPKACTQFSLRQLEKFIRAHAHCQFIPLNELL